MNFGGNLQALRRQQGLSQEQLAAYLSISQTNYSIYELGKVNIPIEAWIKLAEYYQTTIDYLVGRTDEKTPLPKPKKKR